MEITLKKEELGSWNNSKVIRGAKFRVLKSDAAGGSTHLAVLQQGTVIPKHKHSSLEQIYVLEGQLMSDGLLIESGTFIEVPGGVAQGPYRALSETSLFIIRKGPKGEPGL